jgi:hypothetical protein
MSDIIIKRSHVSHKINLSLTKVIYVESGRSVILQIAGDTDEVDINTHVENFPIPETLDDMNIIRATAQVTVEGGDLEIQIRNVTQYPDNDSLSTPITLAENEIIATPGVIDALYKAVNTDDRLKIYVTAQSGTKPKGLYVILEFSK